MSDNKKIVIFEIGIGNPHICRTQNTMGHEDIELHLIEAHPYTYKDLVDRYNNYENVTLYNYAIADYNGEIEFVFDGDSSYIKGVSSPTEQCSLESYRENLHKEKVPCIKISELDKGNIDELLLDMEGSEYFVLKHLISKPSKIFIELGAEKYRNPNYDKIFEWMKNNDYILERMDGDDGVFIKNEDKAREYSILDHTRLKTIEDGINNSKHIHPVDSEIWECGAYRGGTALYMQAHLIENAMPNILRVFDTFCGIPNSSEYDIHKVGDVRGGTLEEVMGIFENVNNVFFHEGKMPDTFKYLEGSKISVAHIDVDNYDSVKSCLEFIYPRVLSGGYIIIDDYNCSSCPGAKKAVDEFLIEKPEDLIIGQGYGNPQAYLIKS